MKQTDPIVIPGVLLTKNGSDRRDLVSQACLAAIRTGSARTGSSSYSRGWRHKNVISAHVVLRLRALGYDAVAMNDAPRGGANGEYVVNTTHRGADRQARAKFVREARAAQWEKVRLATAQEDGFIHEQASQKVRLVNTSPLDVYSGCGVYRVGWRDGKITCALYGGYHKSCPFGTPLEKWQQAVDTIMLNHADIIIKMDGSGTEFFFRNLEDADLVTNATEIFQVPSVYGGLHTNIRPAHAQVLEPHLQP